MTSQSASRTFIHVGFSHSGTKSLQANFFSRRTEFVYCGIPYGELGGIFSFMKYQDAASYDADYLKQLCDDLIWRPSQSDKFFVLSDETFVDQPEIYYTPKMMPIETVALRLREMFPRAKIIFTLRNQLKYVTSSYFNLKRNYALLSNRPIEDFDEWFAGNHSQVKNLFLSNIDYSKAIKTYMNIFGSGAVEVFPLEMLERQGAEAYLRKVGSYMGVSVSHADVLSYATIRNARMSIEENDAVTQHYRGSVHPASGPQLGARDGGQQSAPAEIILTNAQVELIRSRVGSGNRFIANHFDIPLEAYGYLMDDVL